VTGVTALAITYPWLAATIALVLLLLGGFIVYKVFGRIRRYKRRYDAWGDRLGVSAPRSGPGRAQGPPPPPRAVDPPPAPDQGGERPFDQER
jgi:hypothetical protein